MVLDVIILKKGFNSYSPVIGIFLNQKKKNDKPLTVTGDGNQKRDFIYVDDVARMTMEVGISQKETKKFLIFVHHSL